MGTGVQQYCIYENPKDALPGFPFIVRRWEVQAHKWEAAAMAPCDAYGATTLEDARALIPPGLHCIHRFPEDDPCIVEVWM